MISESEQLDDYLRETEVVDFSHAAIAALADKLFHPSQTELEKVKIVFEYVRDEIAHSWDIQSRRITCSASDVLTHKEGICYAKSNLLAALLRREGIPAGFCYQRLMLFDTPDKGYCIHALNGVYLKSLKKWVRLDGRGNKEGVSAEFSVDQEKLAFAVQPEQGEKDYPVIYAAPHSKTIAVLKENDDALDMYLNGLPENL
ncbi:Transglutaminase-like superfamily protein [Fictibacillus solisalsi]|uniref:Transglutaminase-like superfamily protein n=1 Tax=Fictibacillus solisalsi TaxID=459525 RepID=A0A1G9ZT65_9BACL|nr:transglutaminase family protein [Fictibacillus solisalsi]SDN24315.1 Transglutaminase-like superfamily protein [Fictibacillus solisalsi]